MGPLASAPARVLGLPGRCFAAVARALPSRGPAAGFCLSRAQRAERSAQRGRALAPALHPQVFRVDPVRNLMYVRGQVPGHKGNWVLVKDAVKMGLARQPPLPVPTLLGGPAASEVTVAPKPEADPFEYREG